MSLAALYSALANLDASTVSAVRNASCAAAIFCSLASCRARRSCSFCCACSSARTGVACPPRPPCAPRGTSRSSRSFSFSFASFSERSPASSSALACSAESVWIFALSCSCSRARAPSSSLMFAMMASRRESSMSLDSHSSRDLSASFSAPATRSGALLVGLLRLLPLRSSSYASSSARFGGWRRPRRATAQHQAGRRSGYGALRRRRGADRLSRRSCRRPCRDSSPDLVADLLAALERLLPLDRLGERLLGARDLRAQVASAASRSVAWARSLDAVIFARIRSACLRVRSSTSRT